MKSFLWHAVTLLSLAGTVLSPASAAPTEIPNAAQPQLAVGADGRVWLVWGQALQAPVDHHAHAAHAPGGKAKNSPPPADRSADVFVASSSDGGTTFGPAVKIANVPKLMLGMRRGPRLAVHGDRLTVTVVAHELLAFSSQDAGKTWSSPVAINEVPASAREGLHDLAAAVDGPLFVTWLDLRAGKTELWGASSHDGGRSWGRNARIYASPDKSICECCHPTALFDAEGNLAVMWRNSIEGARDMWLTTRPKGAAEFTAARKIGEGTWTLKACPMDGGRLFALGEGKFGAVWQRAGGVFISDANGTEISLGQGKQPVATQTRRGEPLVVWQQGTDLVSARGLSGPAAAKRANDARFPSLVALPGGHAAVLAYERGPAKGPTIVIVERL